MLRPELVPGAFFSWQRAIIKWVMQMKKLLIVLLTLVLIVAGVFFWKGGHHALFLADALEDWLGEDDGAAAVTIQLPQLELTAEGSWREYADRTMYVLDADGVAVYVHEGIVYLDNGRAYTLPDLTGLVKPVRELLTGLVLYGRVSRSGDSYTISMDTDDLELQASIIADPVVRDLKIRAILPDGTAIQAGLTPREPEHQPIPREVTDAMVRAKMERPMVLTDPLEVLLPVLKDALPLTADMKLGVECGILKLAEDVVLTVNKDQAKLTREGVEIDLALPGDLSPVTMGLLLLRNGDFERTADGGVFTVTLPPETTSALCSALVPQIGELGVTFGESRAVLTITDDTLTAISMTAGGEVPFLITTIPVAFSAELNIR